jgi:hypothetical protein
LEKFCKGGFYGSRVRVVIFELFSSILHISSTSD